ncbi:uncharacterized protein LOC115889375 [Sitophilus oryzae]|uniref:Uncharacterized protein LOC115889375 n=1 Tax=Sitophilus oryzae TaxID=7048 RepID=A0A6J2YPL9_SITOR|nr:uncharacterized protein LOC115889375 [Sitophilus oryzae]
MTKIFFPIFGLILSGCLLTVSANVSRCYNCNSAYCGDPYDVYLGSIISCSDVFKNAKLFFSRLVSNSNSASLTQLNETQVGADNSNDIETLSSTNTNEIIRQRSHAEFFDIQRKIWEFFNKGEINENTEFVCVKANYNSSSSSQTKTFRGCVPRSTKTISSACDFVSQRVVGSSSGSSVYGCYACNNDLCNAGITFRASVFVLLAGVALKIVF